MRVGITLVALAIASPTTLLAKAEPPVVRVRIETSAGNITVALDARRAPRTTANFLAYVDDGRFDGTTFYRAARRKSAPGYGLIQGGIDTNARRSLPPVAHEPTSLTGIRHLDATISMARGGKPGTAMGNFFITVGPIQSMDARGAYPGYAAFGTVSGGMGVVKKILAMPTGGGTGPMRGQMLQPPVRIIRAVRLDGVAKPTGVPKPWLLDAPWRKAKRR
ncbi:peptidylprolyl isomerase [Sphingobium algorifonticola]|uniref:peptidylprolyl isomerase n=2 Tax=Sphingobium algorifonticola TaxID=2008318 RepID=A0A437J5N7_9SPHN|nr:peptidylprolyl isomerase [Sphingobium algorifonticola]RVT40245.1 peptidylprolyl isomerase [Sphingobium algorifonticola]